MAVSVYGGMGDGKKAVIGVSLYGRATATHGCVTIPFDVGSSAGKLWFALQERTASDDSRGGIYGSNDGTTYTKVVNFSAYGHPWSKSGVVTGYRYYRIAFSTAGGTGTAFGVLNGAIEYSSNSAESQTIFIFGGTNNTNHIYAANGNLSVKDTETLSSLVDKAIITTW